MFMQICARCCYGQFLALLLLTIGDRGYKSNDWAVRFAVKFPCNQTQYLLQINLYVD